MARNLYNRRHKAVRIGIYNHKGGVGKTTLTINIAYALSKLGKKVLLVDSDPQCNLTSYLIEDSVVDDFLDKSDTNEGKTLWSSIKPINDLSGKYLKIEPYEVNKLFILPGDIRLSELEEDLNDYWTDCFKRKNRGYIGVTALSSLVNELSHDFNFDYVFFDSGPNIGPLNRILILDCDFIIVPAACDLFSLRALKTLGNTLFKWINDWSTILSLAPEGRYLLPGTPIFLGYIPQRFKVYGGKPSLAYNELLPRLSKDIYSEIVVPLRRINKQLAPFSMQEIKLGQVKDFSSIANTAQLMGLPMWDVDGGSLDQKAVARMVFKKIAENIINRTGI